MSFGLVKYIKNIVKPSKKLPKEKDNRIRVVIEGSEYDDWNRLYLDMKLYDVPLDITRINILDMYALDLVAIVNSEGNLEERTLNPDQIKSLYLEYNILTGEISRPTTLITEDGRIFHDMDLLKSNDMNRQRLNYLLTELAKRYGGKEGFERTYKQLTAKNK